MGAIIIKTFAAAVLLSALAFWFPQEAAAKPRLGFGVVVATEGFFGTTLSEVKVTSVVAGGPSEKAGLQVGDLILEIDGMRIKGGSGLTLKKRLENVKQGDRVVLRVQRAGADVVIDIVAGS